MFFIRTCVRRSCTGGWVVVLDYRWLSASRFEPEGLRQLLHDLESEYVVTSVDLCKRLLHRNPCD